MTTKKVVHAYTHEQLVLIAWLGKMLLSALRRLQGQGMLENVYQGSARVGASQPSS